MSTIQERIEKMKNSGPAVSSNVRTYTDTRTEQEKQQTKAKIRERAARQAAQVKTAAAKTVSYGDGSDYRPTAVSYGDGSDPSIGQGGDRVGAAASGAAKGSAAGGVNFVGLLLDSIRNGNSAAQNQRQRAANARDNIARYTAAMETADDAERARLEKLIRSNTAQIELSEKTLENWRKPTDNAVNTLYSTADKLAEGSQRDISKAKEGLGTVGQFAVDLGAAGAQMAGDAVTGGLPAMFVRSAGSAAQEARLSGAGLGQQFAYGLGSGALSVATEKIANVAGPFKKVFGEGLANKAAGKLVEKFGENQAVQIMSRLANTAGGKAVLSAISEGGEEVLEDLVQPYLKRATYDPNAAFDAREAGYDFLVGAAIGLTGSGVEGLQNAGRRHDIMEQEAARLFTPQNGAETTVKSPQMSAAAADTASAQQAAQGLSGAEKAATGVEAAFNENGLGALTEQEKVNLSSGNRNKVISTFQDAVDFVKNAISNKQSVNRAYMGKVPDTVAHIVKQNTGLDISGFGVMMNENDVRHILKDHGDALAEAASGQVAVMPEDIAKIPEVLSTPDRVYLSDELDNKGRKALVFEKQIGDRFITIQGVSDGKHVLQTDTLYIRKGRTRTTRDTMHSTQGAAPVINAQSVPPQSSSLINSTIAQGAENVNPSGQDGSDGLGAADLGSLNSDYENLQAQSDTFHPEGANAARPVDVPTTNFDGRNIPKSTSTIMGAQGVPDSDVRSIEQQIADGELAFDTIKDADSVGRAQSTIAKNGFDGALEQYRQAAGSGIVTKDNTTLGQQLLLQAMRDGNESATAEILAIYTRNSTTAAQAMQAQSIFRKLSPEGQLLAVKKAVDDLNAKYGTDVQLSPEEVAEFLSAKDDKTRKAATNKIMERAAKSVPGTLKAKYDTIRYLAMLGNPRTHIRNILGNTFFQVPVAVKNRVGALVEGAANLATGGKVERTKSLFGVNPLGKLAAECRADFENVKGFLSQNSKYNENRASVSGIEQRADAFSNDSIIGRGINKAADFNSVALEAEDTAAKKFIYTQSLAGYLQANGCKSMADASPELLNRARNYAAQEALRNTFNDKNAVSDFVSSAGKLYRSNNPAAKAAGYVVEGVLPFKRTPANIAVRAVEYSPVGAVLGAVETVRGAAAGDMARVSTGLDRVASGVTGTALLAAGFLAAGAGYVTGGEDEDEKQKNFDALTGHQNYALELKDGTSITLDWLSPEAIPFFMGVELYNSALDGGKSWTDVLDAVKNASAPMLEMSMLQGLNDTFENAAFAQNRGESVMGALAVSALTNYATQIFPTIGGQLERSSEDQRMTTYTDKGSQIPTDLQYTLGKVSQKIPGWDFQQIPYIDAWGRTEESGDALVRSVNNLFNPAYMSQVDVDEVEQELQRVKDATGDGSVFPQRAERSIEYTPEGKESLKHDLTAEEYVKYARKLGQESYSIVKQGMATQDYKKMSDAEKAEYLGSLYSYASQTAKASMYSDYPMQPKYANAKNAKRDLGVSAAEYLALYDKYGSDIMSGKAYNTTIEAVKEGGMTVAEYAGYKDSVKGLAADKDANGESISGSKKQKVIGAIAELDLSPTEKDWLYLLNYDGKNAKMDLQSMPWN